MGHTHLQQVAAEELELGKKFNILLRNFVREVAAPLLGVGADEVMFVLGFRVYLYYP
jgi:hypothetical protein